MPDQPVIQMGQRCPCGHLLRNHQMANPTFRVGQLVELHGACTACSCAAQICLAPDETPNPEEDR